MSGNNLPDGRRDINTSNLSCHKEFSFWKYTLTHLLFFIRAHEWAHSKKLFFNCYNQKCYWKWRNDINVSLFIQENTKFCNSLKQYKKEIIIPVLWCNV